MSFSRKLKKAETTIGKIVSGAWRKFKEWWDEHKREVVEKKTSESVLGKLAELKKETTEQPRKPIILKKHREPEREIVLLDDSNGSVPRSRYM